MKTSRRLQDFESVIQSKKFGIGSRPRGRDPILNFQRVDYSREILKTPRCLFEGDFIEIPQCTTHLIFNLINFLSANSIEIFIYYTSFKWTSLSNSIPKSLHLFVVEVLVWYEIWLWYARLATDEKGRMVIRKEKKENLQISTLLSIFIFQITCVSKKKDYFTLFSYFMLRLQKKSFVIWSVTAHQRGISPKMNRSLSYPWN